MSEVGRVRSTVVAVIVSVASVSVPAQLTEICTTGVVPMMSSYSIGDTVRVYWMHPQVQCADYTLRLSADAGRTFQYCIDDFFGSAPRPLYEYVWEIPAFVSGCPGDTPRVNRPPVSDSCVICVACLDNPVDDTAWTPMFAVTYPVAARHAPTARGTGRVAGRSGQWYDLRGARIAAGVRGGAVVVQGGQWRQLGILNTR